jgi:hypothetical protein
MTLVTALIQALTTVQDNISQTNTTSVIDLVASPQELEPDAA